METIAHCLADLAGIAGPADLADLAGPAGPAGIALAMCLAAAASLTL